MEGVCMTSTHVILTDEPDMRLSLEALVLSFMSVGRDLCAPAVPSAVLMCSSVNAQEDIILLQTWLTQTQIGKVVSQ